MKASLKQLQHITFAAKGESGHWVMMDGAPEFGGSDAASRPMEMILFGFGGCASADIASILEKRRVDLRAFDVEIEAERAAEHPKVFTKIHLTFKFTGKGVKPADVERAIELARTKYCSVWAMLQHSVEITHSYEIHETA